MRKWIYLEPSKSVPGCSIFHDLRDYKPSKAKKQFSDVKNISREKARRPKKTSTSCNLITQCNPLLPNIKTIIKKHLPVLHSSHETLQISPENNVNVTYRLNKNWKEPISPSLFPRTIKKTSAQLKNVTEDAKFVKIFWYYLLLVMLPNANTK